MTPSQKKNIEDEIVELTEEEIAAIEAEIKAEEERLIQEQLDAEEELEILEELEDSIIELKIYLMKKLKNLLMLLKK